MQNLSFSPNINIYPAYPAGRKSFSAYKITDNTSFAGYKKIKYRAKVNPHQVLKNKAIRAAKFIASIAISATLVKTCLDAENCNPFSKDFAKNINLPKNKTQIELRLVNLKSLFRKGTIITENNRLNIKSADKSSAKEIEYYKKASYKDRNRRLYKLLTNEEDKPELLKFLLQSRVEYLNKAMKPEWNKQIEKLCKKYLPANINYEDFKLLTYCQALQESALNPKAVSSSGAKNLMQIMPATAELLNKKYYFEKGDKEIHFDHEMDIDNPMDNLEMGIALMRENVQRYKGSYIPALAAYNAGPLAVDAYLSGKSIKVGTKTINSKETKIPDGIPPYPETQLYCKVILTTYQYIKENPRSIKID